MKNKAAKTDNAPNDKGDYIEWLTLAETARILKCSEWKVRELRKAGRLEAVKFDHQWRVTRSSLQKLLDKIFSGGKQS